MAKEVKAQPAQQEEPKLDNVEDCKNYIQAVIKEHNVMKGEMMAALKIIAALVLTQGGKVRIPQKTMLKSHNSDTFLNYATEPGTEDFLIEVTTTPPKAPPVPKTKKVKKSSILVAQNGSRLIH